MSENSLVSDFKAKWVTGKLPEVWEVVLVKEYETIYVYTSNAKNWVDLPEKFGEMYVEMVVQRKPRPKTKVLIP